MIASDVGSDFADFDMRIKRIREFVNSDLKDEALKELVNFKQSLFNGLNEISPANSALAVLVKSIDGKKVEVNTGAEIDYVMGVLENHHFTKEQRDKKTSEVKKKNRKRTFDLLPEVF